MFLIRVRADLISANSKESFRAEIHPGSASLRRPGPAPDPSPTSLDPPCRIPWTGDGSLAWRGRAALFKSADPLGTVTKMSASLPLADVTCLPKAGPQIVGDLQRDFGSASHQPHTLLGSPYVSRIGDGSRGRGRHSSGRDACTAWARGGVSGGTSHQPLSDRTFSRDFFPGGRQGAGRRGDSWALWLPNLIASQYSFYFSFSTTQSNNAQELIVFFL